jgi:hypothetical protein
MNAGCLGNSAVTGGAGCQVFTIRPSCLIGILVEKIVANRHSAVTSASRLSPS